MNNILSFYLAANKLKQVIRTGWMEVGISSERLESVAEHIYGCLILAVGLDSEYDLGLDMYKVFKMITLNELEKTTLNEVTTRKYDTKEERQAAALDNIAKITDGLMKKDEIIGLIEEYWACETKEAKFVYQLGKIESDIQAKIYDLSGQFDLDKALEDAKYYGEELSNEIIPQMKNASDGWILYDRHLYSDEVFKEMSKKIQDMKEI